MKVSAQIKLLSTEEQASLLKRTLEATNNLCNWLSAKAWEAQTLRQFDLHLLCYHEARKTFSLAAQVVVRSIAKVADAYKLDRKRQRTFRPLGAVEYDSRLLSWKGDKVSLWTVAGRVKLAYACGERQRRLLATKTQTADLCFVRGNFILSVICDVEVPDPSDVSDVLGVDCGLVNIATTSDGENFSGSHVNNIRARYRRARQRMQRKGTKSARRRLRHQSGRERRFAANVNHVVSRGIVNTAERTGRAIAIENLVGIRSRLRATRRQRAVLHSWAFYQLRAFIEYKARLVGVKVITVDPRNTSRTCPSCGHCEKANRPQRDNFQCRQCGHAGPADAIAAENIAVLGRAAVNQPYVSETQGSSRDKPPALAGGS